MVSLALSNFNPTSQRILIDSISFISSGNTSTNSTTPPIDPPIDPPPPNPIDPGTPLPPPPNPSILPSGRHDVIMARYDYQRTGWNKEGINYFPHSKEELKLKKLNPNKLTQLNPN